MILKFFLWAFFTYILYKVIFNFVLPVLKVSGHLKRQVREFQQSQMHQQPNTPPPGNSSKASRQTAAKEGDYIDFEEVKS